MNKIIHPSGYEGLIKAPSSKSYMQRAVAIALLAEGETIIENADFSKDSRAILQMASQLGAQIQISENRVVIKGKPSFNGGILSAGESGLGIRTFIPLVSLFSEKIELSGEGSLLQRPIFMVEGPLNQLGVQTNSQDGYLPISVKGPLKGGHAEVDGSISSQFLSGLLIALPLVKNNSVLTVNKLQSIPYIDMTLDILKDFGAIIEHHNYEEFTIKGHQKYLARNYQIEGDWSNAAFHLVAAAIDGNVIVRGLNLSSLQADKAILEALRKAGAQIISTEEWVHIIKAPLQAFDFDATHCPDLFPPLVVLAAACKGITTLKGVRRLFHKESNRALVLQKEMGKIGINIIIEQNIMKIKGGRIKGGSLHSNNDHRIAMAAVVAGLTAHQPVEIKEAEAVNKSYPEFFKDFESLCL